MAGVFFARLPTTYVGTDYDVSDVKGPDLQTNPTLQGLDPRAL